MTGRKPPVYLATEGGTVICMPAARKSRRRKDEIREYDPGTGEVDVEATIEARQDADQWPINFEPPPGGDKAWTGLALALLNLERDLTRAAIAVLGILIDHANPKTGQCNPSITRIAKGINRHRRTVFRAIAELKDDDLVGNLAVNHNGARRRVGNADQINWKRLRSVLDEYEFRIKKAKRQAQPVVTSHETVEITSDTMMSPTSDTQHVTPQVTPYCHPEPEREPIKEPNTPKVDHASRGLDDKSSDSEVLKRLKAARGW